MDLNFLANSMPWFGAHTGYDKLPAYLAKAEDRVEVFLPRRGWLPRAMGKLVSGFRGHGATNQADAEARWRLERALRARSGALAHVLYGETHLLYWRAVPEELLRRSVLTLHQPASTWTEEMAAALAAYPHIMALWQRDLPWFQQHHPRSPIHFIRHGVDTDFFSPGPPAANGLRLLYAGVHLRNTAMLVRVITRLGELRPELRFDLLVPPDRRARPGLPE